MFNQTTYGIVILILLGMLVVVKRIATGSILEKPEGSFFLRAVNSFNLFFLLIVNPLAAILLLVRRADVIDPTHVNIYAIGVLKGVEIGGMIICFIGYLLMAWALLSIGRYYQLGGNSPRSDDRMVIKGPYRSVRHPMYLAALCISLGLACLIQSIAYFTIFCIYLILMIFLIPIEETKLLAAYGKEYSDYQKRVKILIPGFY
jgi:protein-S-isoprenylcysteine O-methyltransferase Ste14